MSAANPVLVELTRDGRVESVHRGAYALADATGTVVAGAGDTDTQIYPRSAVKPFQALPLVLTGAAEALGYGPPELALACASHSGEPRHVAIVRSMLQKAGLGPSDLQCGTHWSLSPEVARQMAAAGEEPGPLHHNCSGKHAGMLAVARHLGVPVENYLAPEHPVQRRIAAVLEELTDCDMATAAPGVDGCGVPSWPLPLAALARGCARFATGEKLGPETAAACRQVHDAAVAHPVLVAGTGRFCTRAMELLGEAALVKTGAEGVFCVMMPDKALGLAVKIDDGAKRAAEAVTAAHLEDLFAAHPAGETLAGLAHRQVRTVRGQPVGQVRVRLRPR